MAQLEKCTCTSGADQHDDEQRGDPSPPVRSTRFF
jgi:hypothetical protein